MCDKHDQCKRKRNDKEATKNTHTQTGQLDSDTHACCVRADDLDFLFFLREPFFFVIELSKEKDDENEEEMYLNTNRINYYLSSQFLFTKYGQNGTFIPLPHAIRFAYRYAFITNRIRWIDSRLYIFYDVYYYLWLSVVLVTISILGRSCFCFVSNLPSTLFIVWQTCHSAQKALSFP